MSQNQTSDFSNITEEIKELEAKIRERKDFLDKVKECVVEVTQKIGMVRKVIKHSINDYNVHTVREFAGFDFFSFYYSTGETPLGGRKIKVKYLDKLILLFIFPAFADSEYKVLFFADSGSWQEEIDKAIANKEVFISNYLRKAEEGKDEALEKERAEAQLAQLQKEASQLAIL